MQKNIPSRVVVAPLPRITEGPRASLNEATQDTLRDKLMTAIEHLAHAQNEVELIHGSALSPRPEGNDPPPCIESLVDQAGTLANRALVILNDLSYIRSRLG